MVSRGSRERPQLGPPDCREASVSRAAAARFPSLVTRDAMVELSSLAQLFDTKGGKIEAAPLNPLGEILYSDMYGRFYKGRGGGSQPPPFP